MSSTERIEFTLNGVGTSVDTDPRRPLVEVLRDDLGLTGTKIGCSSGHCGACSVIVDGEVVESCTTPMRKVAGRKVTTIEGIGSVDNPHPIQKAFVEAGAVQCGFCTPGMVVSAKALLDATPNPSPDQIVETFSRNLCRCTGYVKIIDAVLKAAGKQTTQEMPTANSDGNVVGASVPRRDAMEKATGETVYAADEIREGMLHAKVLRSPHHHAEIVSIDTGEAEALDGVEAVLTARDVPGENAVGVFLNDQPVLAHKKVRQVGDPVAVVAARTEEIAKAALAKIKVEYCPLEAVFDPLASLEAGAPKLHEGGNLLFERNIVKGDVDQGFAQADVIVENVYRTSRNEHAYLEPEAGLSWIDDEGRVVVLTCTQNPHHDLKLVSAMLGLPAEKVRIIQSTTGGGFGGKLEVSVEGVLGLLAFKLRKPVKLVYSRKESFVSSSKRHPFHIQHRIGATKDGKITAVDIKVIADTGSYASFGPGVITRAAIHASGPYDIPNYRFNGKMAYTNNPFCGAMRGFGVPQMTFAMESQMDLLAEQLGMDPWRIRHLNGYDYGSATSTGQVLSESVTFKSTLEAVREAYLQAKLRAETASDGKIKRGVGLGCMWFGLGKTSLPNKSEARVELLADGKVHVYTGAADVGQGSNTTLAQIAADELGLPFDSVLLTSADTGLTPDSDFTCASRQTYCSGNAVSRAANNLKSMLLETAGSILGEEGTEDLVVKGGYISSNSGGAKKLSFARLAEICREENAPLSFQASFHVINNMLDPKTGAGNPYPSFSYGTQVAEVEVNTETGEVKVLRIVAAHDVGKAVNPVNLQGQMEGGVAMGLGYALTEEFIPGKTNGFAQYRIPTTRDMPEIEAIVVEVPEPSGPFGAKGAGESASVPTAAAIVNAIAAATGARVHQLPATPKRVLQALEAAGQGKA